MGYKSVVLVRGMRMYRQTERAHRGTNHDVVECTPMVLWEGTVLDYGLVQLC